MPPSSTTDPRRAAATRHMKAGAYRAALQLYEAILEETPDEADVLNDAALACAQEGNTQQAEAYLRRALEAQPDHEAAFYNLLDLLLENRDDLGAAEAFADYEAAIPDSRDKKQYQEKLNMAPPLAASGDGAPVAERDTDTLRVGFVCGPDRKFIGDIEREIGKKHEVRTAYFDDKVNLEQIQQLMDWADVTWFEWCDQILVHASQKLRKTSRVVCRLHSYEALSNFPHHVRWEFVDRLVLVASHMETLFKNRFPEIAEKTSLQVISNGVALNRFPFKEREPGHNLAYVGYLNHKKNPSLLLQCLHALVEKDGRYHLHVAGIHQESRYEIYWEHMIDALALRGNITMHGWINDISDWLNDKQYLISTSVHESFGYGIAEAMARGIKPAIHHFQGADELFPSSVLFRTIPEFVELIREETYESESYRQHIEERYALEGQIEIIDQIMRQVASPNSQVASSNSLEPHDQPGHAHTVHLPQGLKMMVPAEDHISASLQRGQFYEAEMLAFIRSKHTSSLRAIDIGAHIGNHSVFLAGVCKAEMVYSFEPNPASFSYLDKNIKLNKLDNVTPHQAAVGEKEGTVSVTRGPSHNSGMATVDINQDGNTPLVTLDTTIDDTIDIIKIDVEGMAGSVLRGSLAIIRKYKPDLYIECADVSEYNEVVKILTEVGYVPRHRFNYTPTILFEYAENQKSQLLTYEQACALR